MHKPSQLWLVDELIHHIIVTLVAILNVRQTEDLYKVIYVLIMRYPMFLFTHTPQL